MKTGKSKRYLTGDQTTGVYQSEWKLVVPKNIFNLKNGEVTDADI